MAEDFDQKQFIADNAHIPTEEIEQDIRDTEVEIAQMILEADHLENTPMTMSSARLDHMRASSRRSGIKERKYFIEKLQILLDARRPKPECSDPDLQSECSGCTDDRSEGTHQGCTKQHGHVGCKLDI